jgi:hypothetical protein
MLPTNVSYLACVERKSRFEVHHSHAGALTPTNGTGLNSPVLSATQILSREPSQSRVAGDLGLSRDSSVTRVSRFSVEPSQSPLETGPPSAAASTAGTPNASQNKRSRFQVSNVEGRPGDIAPGNRRNMLRLMQTRSASLPTACTEHLFTSFLFFKLSRCRRVCAFDSQHITFCVIAERTGGHHGGSKHACCLCSPGDVVSPE